MVARIAPVALLLAALTIGIAHAQWPASTGQSGLINMPDARTGEDGLLRFGLSNADPYLAGWLSVTALPGLEFSARYTRIAHTAPPLGSDYGNYKDKAFDAKWNLLHEGEILPALTVGVQDYLGTRIFYTPYVVAGKRWDDLDLTLGYGEERIDGWFGGIRYQPRWAGPASFVVEYDAYDYPSDILAVTSGAANREKGLNWGINLRWKWLGAQLSLQEGGTVGANAWVAIPLDRGQFIPKIDEPPPDTEWKGQVGIGWWQHDPRYAEALVERLEAQGFRDISVRLEGRQLELILAHPRISQIGRVAGRAVRTALLRGPSDIDSIQITVTERDLPVLTYRFIRLDQLRRYFGGLLGRQQLERYIQVSPASPNHAWRQQQEGAVLVLERRPVEGDMAMQVGGEGETLLVRAVDPAGGNWRIAPFRLNTFFNDPSGAFHYDLHSVALYRNRLRRGLYLDGAVRLTLLEDVSEVTQPSNSLLPHVRTDIARYLDGGVLRLTSLSLNHFSMPAERTWLRLSAGWYELMFGGVGGQILHAPHRGNWAADLSIDWVRQRDYDGGFGFRDYDTVTALAAFHYRFPRRGITATLRAGRFLAKDEGVRMELKRRFRSGIELGAWYTVTNGNDITSPGTPDDPYNDKGIFVAIPLNTLLTRDTRARSGISLAPWTRDVGQMVRAPFDLYRLLEDRTRFDSGWQDPLTAFGQ